MGTGNGQVIDLYERALCLGYDNDAAARLADCFDVPVWSDPCAIHPGHSTTQDHNGYAVDGCEACKVIALSDADGYYPGRWAAIETEREAEYVKIMEAQIADAYSAGECACDLIMEMGAARLPQGGRVCQVCGSTFTPMGVDLSEAVAAESARIVAARLGGSAPVERDDKRFKLAQDVVKAWEAWNAVNRQHNGWAHRGVVVASKRLAHHVGYTGAHRLIDMCDLADKIVEEESTGVDTLKGLLTLDM